MSASQEPTSRKSKRSSSVKNSVEISDDVLPLVMPNVIPKTSKDPNRTLYPRLRSSRYQHSSHLKSSSSSHSQSSDTQHSSHARSSFEKASTLYKKSRSSSACVSNIEENQTSETVKNEVNSDLNEAKSKQYESRLHRKRKLDQIDGKKQKNKIFKYFEFLKPKINNITFANVTDHTAGSVATSSESANKLTCVSLPGATENSVNTSKDNLDSVIDGSYYFGLFGSTDKCEEPEEYDGFNYFELLPPHIMDAIFFKMPFYDLMKCKLVCKPWNEMISDEKFAEWKKRYYSLKYGHNRVDALLKSLCDSIEKCNVTNCLKNLIRYMSTGFNKKFPCDMLYLVEGNKLYALAESVLLERFPEWSSENVNPWSVLAMVVLLSETIQHIEDTLHCLFVPETLYFWHDIMDAVYCIATFLLYFTIKYNINHGLHFRLYTVLYHLENKNPEIISKGMTTVHPQSGITGQQSIHSYCAPVTQKQTYEQMRILNHRLKLNQVVKIVAFAGTGKTTTLAQYARQYPQLKFLNVMYNKAVCLHAAKCFPSNVECRTAHSLAYAKVGKYYRFKMNFKLRPHDIVPHLKKPKDVHMHIYTFAKCVLRSVETFTASADPEITTAHVPEFTTEDDSKRRITDRERLAICNEAASYWDKMKDKEEKTCKVTHDVYLKLFQLEHPKFSKFHCIMIDEAQDCNAAMLDIMLSQRVPIILVGDPNQQIYGFRGAKNALENVQATHVYYLTKSFRFGNEIAYLASCCVETLKCNTRQTLVGNSRKSFINGRIEGQYAIIARSNMQLLVEVIRMCCINERRSWEPDKVLGAFAGGLSSYELEQVVDIYRLKYPGRITGIVNDRFIRKFKSYDELELYTKSTGDSNLQGKIDLVRRFVHDIPQFVDIIREKCRFPLEMANVVFSTAHKSKGLEFDTVCLTNDYSVGRIPQEVPTKDSACSEEYNILYVALTRAKKCLIINENMYKVLLLAQEKFEYPLSSKMLLESSPTLKCVVCAKEFVPHTEVVMFRRRTIMSNGHNVESGPLCMYCGSRSTYRPEIHTSQVILMLDPLDDTAHRSTSFFTGPLPSDPPPPDDDNLLDHPRLVLDHLFVFFNM